MSDYISKTTLSESREAKLQVAATKRRVYCKCGHSVIMDYKRDEKICSWCGNKVKKSGKLLFKDKLRRKLNEVER